MAQLQWAPKTAEINDLENLRKKAAIPQNCRFPMWPFVTDRFSGRFGTETEPGNRAGSRGRRPKMIFLSTTKPSQMA